MRKSGSSPLIGTMWRRKVSFATRAKRNQKDTGANSTGCELVLTSGPPPTFPKDWDARAEAFGPGTTILYSDQCPYIPDAVRHAREALETRGSNSLRELLWNPDAPLTPRALGSLAPMTRLDAERHAAVPREGRAHDIFWDSRSAGRVRLGGPPWRDR